MRHTTHLTGGIDHKPHRIAVQKCKRTLRINLPFDIPTTSPWCLLGISAGCLGRTTRAEPQHLHAAARDETTAAASAPGSELAGGEQR